MKPRCGNGRPETWVENGRFPAKTGELEFLPKFLDLEKVQVKFSHCIVKIR